MFFLTVESVVAYGECETMLARKLNGIGPRYVPDYTVLISQR